MVLLNQNPWQGIIPDEMHRELTKEAESELSPLLHRFKPSLILSKFFLFVEQKLQTGIIEAATPLFESMIAFLEINDDNDSAKRFRQYMPKSEILVEHCTNCFAYLVKQIDSLNA